MRAVGGTQMERLLEARQEPGEEVGGGRGGLERQWQIRAGVVTGSGGVLQPARC